MTSITSTTTLVMSRVDVTGSTAYGPTIGPATRSDAKIHSGAAMSAYPVSRCAGG